MTQTTIKFNNIVELHESKSSNGEIVNQIYSDISSRSSTITNFNTQSTVFANYETGTEPSKLKTFWQFFATVKEAFPDYQLTINNIFVKDDRVMTCYTICGTHERDFMGLAPTKSKMTIRGLHVFRLENGKVIEYSDAAQQICARR